MNDAMSQRDPRPRTWFEKLFPDAQPDGELGDFTATRRMLPLCVVAIGIGVLSGAVAKVLLTLIAVFTNLFFFQRLDTAMVTPSANTLGPLLLLVPTGGGLLIGLMARYGSEKIRGHGIPEALESILMRGSRVEPKLAVLKPVSAAISIGSGGPFGAEGPIIMTGGAFGSLIAQTLHLTAQERKTLLVAGATAGMAATFASPLAAMMLGVELLLFEWKPRSFVPVALACAAAMATRQFLLEAGPLFPVTMHAQVTTVTPLLGAVAAGVGAGLLSSAMTFSVYFFEDGFLRYARRIHWMWWPAIAGLVIGLGGLVCPRALGVGYDVIGDLLNDRLSPGATLVLVVVKWAIWSFALGSGTSGGVLAPLLMLGAGLGSLESRWLPDCGPGFWPLVSMGAILGGTMRAPFTGILFAMEITHDWNALLPLAIAVTVAHGFTVLVLRRSILTEKVARRGYHLSREYAIDPLEVLFVREVMRPVNGALPESTAFADETLRALTYRMAEHRIYQMAVLDREKPGVPVGVVQLEDVLYARRRHLEEETRRERPLKLTLLLAPFRALR